MISLGERCWSRIFPEVFHLYDFKARDVRMPFDGCITKYGAVCELIETNFENVYVNMRTFKDNNGTDIIETNYSHYNHERSNNFDEFKEQMKKRITQFENTISECIEKQSLIVFILQHRSFPKKLIKILQQKFPKLLFKIICVNKFANKTKPLRDENTQQCRYIETTHTKGTEYDTQVLDIFLNTITEYSKIDYDRNLIFSKRAKNP